jgi:sulfite reductase (ferredoxin)
LEEALNRLGLPQETFTLRMTGCPNGCARPYASEVGLVGRMPEHYALYVGADFLGTRLNFKLLDKVHENDVVPTLEKLLADFKVHRGSEAETFGDYCHRQGQDALLKVLA